MVRLAVTNPKALVTGRERKRLKGTGSWWWGFWQRQQGMVEICHLKDISDSKAFAVASH